MSSGSGKAAMHLLRQHSDKNDDKAAGGGLQKMFREQLADTIFEGEHKKPVLSFVSPKPTGIAKNRTATEGDHEAQLRKNFASMKEAGPKTTVREINTQPMRVLDAPGLYDDFYLNLLDWSSRNTLAVGANA